MPVNRLTLLICHAAIVTGAGSGCFTVPSGYDRQSNGQLRPERLIGSEQFIRPGQTPIGDAIAVVLATTGGSEYRIASNAHAFAVAYRLDAGTRVIPLVDTFMDQQGRWLILDTDDGDVVLATQTVAKLPIEFNYAVPTDAVMRNLSSESRQMMIEKGGLVTAAQYDRICTVRQTIDAILQHRR